MADGMEWLRQYAFEAGIGGLAGLAAVDSFGVPTGGGPDLVLALLASLRGALAYGVGLVAAATLGSTLGCWGLYAVARRGGRQRRFGADAIARASRALDRRGAWIVLAAMLAPPPIPTKLFVFCAGIAAVPRGRFLLATVAGRLLRYGLVAALAVRYGPAVIDTVRAHAAPLAAVLAGPLLVWLAWRLLRRWRNRSQS